MTSSNSQQYGDFEQFYNQEKLWARTNIALWLTLRFGKQADRREFEHQAQVAFEQSRLGHGLSMEKAHPKYHSDFELAQQRFITGIEDAVFEVGIERGLIKR
jgi:hypothetical protein